MLTAERTIIQVIEDSTQYSIESFLYSALNYKNSLGCVGDEDPFVRRVLFGEGVTSNGQSSPCHSLDRSVNVELTLGVSVFYLVCNIETKAMQSSFFLSVTLYTHCCGNISHTLLW